MRPSLLTTLLLCALTAHTLFRPRFANETDRYSLPSPNAVLAAADVPLGVVTVRLAGRNVTDSEALRAAVLSGLAMSTDWMSVGDATAVRVDATSDERAPTPTTSTPCGTSAPALTYIIALAPAVLPTAAQARQLVDGASSSISKQLAGAKLKDVRVVATDAALDDSLFAARPAPFPQHATAGSDNVMLGWLRATGYGMSLCEVGLTALRTLQRQELVVSAAYIEATAANGTSAAKGLPAPSRRHNLANTRIVRVVPKGHDVNSADVTLDLAAAAGGDVPDVLDMRIAVAGLTSDQAVRDVAAIRAASRSGKLTRELQKTPGLGTASLGHTPDDWFYNGHDLEGDPISSGALAAAITVPTLAAVGLAVGGGVFITRRRRRARVRAAKVAMLAANGLGTGSAGSAGSGKPSELLRAMAQATPTVTDPLARLAAVDWELDPADLEVSTGDDGAEVELGTGANGRVVRGRYTKTGQDVAIKILTRRDDEGRGLEDLSKEIVMLRACRHPNIVSFVGASIRDGVPPILVVELMPRGDLYRALDNPKCRSVFTWQGQLDGGRPRPYTGMNRRVALDISRGLAYLHTRGIVHLDVKSLNVLLAHDLTAKLADVGAARALGDAAAATLTSPAGTLAWMAPEVWTGEGRATDRADVYSLGVVLWELSTGERPRRPLRPVADGEAPPPVRALIQACLSPDPTARPTAAAVMAALEAVDDDGNVVVASRSAGTMLESTLAKSV